MLNVLVLFIVSLWLVTPTHADEQVDPRCDAPPSMRPPECDGPTPTSGDVDIPVRTETQPPTLRLEADQEEAAAQLRAAAAAEREREASPDRPLAAASPEGTDLGAREVTREEHLAAQQAREEEAAAQAAAERARAQAEELRARRLAEQASGGTCSRDKENLMNHQRQIFELRSPQGKSLLELLKAQDDLKAKIATYQTLLNIWKDYQDFLSSNENLVNGSMRSPASAQEALGRLNEIENLIGNNQQAVERYHVVAEVLNAIPDRDALRNLETDQQKFDYIALNIENRCMELGAQASSLYMCGIDFQQELRLEPVINRNPNTRGELINKFINTAINIDGNDWAMDINFSSLYVDDPEHTNLTGHPEFARTMQRVIQRSKDHCRDQILLGQSQNITCLNAPLSEVLGNELGDAQNHVIRRLEALNPNGPAIENVGDLTQSYLQMARRTNAFHEEMAGGTINELRGIAENLEGLGAQFASAEEALTNPATVRAVRDQFKNLTQEKILNLGRSLNHDEFQRNQELFSKYLDGNSNLLSAPGALDFQKDGSTNKAQFANQMVRQILCGQSRSGCALQGNIFSQNGDELVLDQNNIIAIFQNMMESAGGPDALKNILGEEQEQGLKDDLANIQAQIAAIKNGDQYRGLNAFKDFIWEQAKDSCMEGTDEGVTVHQGSTCTLPGNIQTGLNDFLQIGDDFLSYQNREEARGSLEALNQACSTMHDQDNARYTREYVQTGICPAVFEERRRVTRAAITSAENARRGPTTHDPNIIYEYDSEGRVVDRHVPDSNLAVFLPQAAYVVNSQLPFYFVQRPGMNMAIKTWRQQGIQQKTAQAYWDAQRQSFLNSTVCGPFGCYYNSTMLETASPTFGNFGFAFGSTTTTPTTFNTGVNTIPSTNSTGFGF